MTKQRQPAKPLLFGNSERELFGFFHAAANAQTSPASVLLCAPFGQEMIRAQRTFKVLAERLARAGYPTLRFDYFGSGDSGGEDTQISMPGIGTDIVVADRKLRELAGSNPVIWLGLGLGATAAWREAATASRPPDHLLLWDPILNGQTYLDTLTHRHDVFLDQSFGFPSPNIPREKSFKEAIGFAVSKDFEGELMSLTPQTLPALPSSVSVDLVVPGDKPELAAIIAHCDKIAQPIRHTELANEIDWIVETIESGAIVPAKALQRLIKLVKEYQ